MNYSSAAKNGVNVRECTLLALTEAGVSKRQITEIAPLIGRRFSSFSAIELLKILTIESSTGVIFCFDQMRLGSSYTRTKLDRFSYQFDSNDIPNHTKALMKAF
ncbi:hypothetical protein [Marinomonas foliarum]|uniref:Uncharacterized protein n=1 Tax=Marinomonas foliarum TaxID=491950 RepID=A0A368ZNK4_9GAMM|nr:hypothetical protein [Marinomonas foliarum]RCW96311.1 hypothetical protein DFP77_13514 [Marinomonas foliarum]